MSEFGSRVYEPFELTQLQLIGELASFPRDASTGESLSAALPALAAIGAAKANLMGRKIALDGSIQQRFVAVMDGIVEKVPSGAAVPRWMSAEEAAVTVGEFVAQHDTAIRGLAARLGMIRSGEYEDVSRVDPETAVFIVEGGANKTSVVRRGVAEAAMHRVYGEDISDRVLYQFGSDRIIPLERTNRTGAVIPNQEHATIRSLAPDLPEDASFTEFEANVATALADGYEIEWDSSKLTDAQLSEGTARRVVLRHDDPGRSVLHAIRPAGKGLADGLTALVHSWVLSGNQLVIATNGQYRPMNELIAARWARGFLDRRVVRLPSIALGDEPGDVFPFAGGEIPVPARPTEVYLHEIALYGQALVKQ